MPLSFPNTLKLWSLSFLLSAFLIGTGPAVANPSGPSVRHGQVTIRPGVQTQIEQLTNKAIIDWSSFSIGTGEAVRFLQPNDIAVVLNRVTGGDPSKILGQLTANGQVFLINPNGILFGAGSVVNVGGFVASTLNITNEDFLAGQYVFKQDPGSELAAVINRGQITITEGGYAVLTGPSVINEGSIVAKTGNLVLAAGEQSTLNLDGRDLIHFALQDKVSEGAVVLAPGMLSDALADTLGVDASQRADQLVRLPDGSVRLKNSSGTLVQSGTVSADGKAGKNAGSVLLDAAKTTTLTADSLTSAAGHGLDSDGGRLLVLSTVDTNLPEQGKTRVLEGAAIAAGSDHGNGGFMEVSGNHVDLQGRIELEARNGQNGTFLLDPTNVRVIDGNNGPMTVGGEDLIGDGFIESMLGVADFLLDSTTTITFDVTGTSGGADSGIQSNSANSFSVDAGSSISLGSDTIDIDGGLSLFAGDSIDLGNSSISALNFDAFANGLIRSNGNRIDTRQDPNVLSGMGQLSLNADNILLENSLFNFEQFDAFGTTNLTISNSVLESETEPPMGGNPFPRHVGDIFLDAGADLQLSGGSVLGQNITISSDFVDSVQTDIQGDADVVIGGSFVNIDTASAGGTLDVTGGFVGVGSGSGSDVFIAGDDVSLNGSFISAFSDVLIQAGSFLDITNASISADRVTGTVSIDYRGDQNGFDSTAQGSGGLSAANVSIASIEVIDLSLLVNSADFVRLSNPPATDAPPTILRLPNQNGNVEIRDTAQNFVGPNFTRTPRGISLERVSAGNSIRIETPSDLVLTPFPFGPAPTLQTSPGGTVSLTAGRISDRNATGVVAIDTSGGGLGAPGTLTLTATEGGIGTTDALDGTTGAGSGPIDFIANRITAASLGAGAPIRLTTDTTPLQLINLSTNNGLVNLTEGPGATASVVFSDAASSGDFLLSHNVTAPAFLFTNTGNVFLDQFTLAPGMTAALTSTQGRLLNQGSNGSVVLNGNQAILRGNGGLGTSASPLRISGGTAALNSAAGDIFVLSNTALNLTNVAVTDQGQTLANGAGAAAAQDVSLSTTAGNVEVNAPISSTNGSIVLNAAQTINVNTDVTATTANVLLTAGDTVQKVSTSTISSTGLGIDVGNSLGSQGTPFSFQAQNLVIRTGATGSAFLQETGTGTTVVNSLTGAGTTLANNTIGQNLELFTDSGSLTVDGALSVGNEAVLETSRGTASTAAINLNADVSAAKLALLAPGDITQSQGNTVTAPELAIKSGGSISGGPENFEIATQKLVLDAGTDALVRQASNSVEVVDQIQVLGTNQSGGNAGNNMRINVANGNLTINSPLTAGAEMALVTGSTFNITPQFVANGGDLVLNQNVGGGASFVGVAGLSIVQGNPAATINSPQVGLAANGNIGTAAAPIDTTGTTGISLNTLNSAFINQTGIPRVPSVSAVGVTVFDNGVGIGGGGGGTPAPGPGTPGVTTPDPTTPLVDTSLPQNRTELVEENLADPNLVIGDFTWLNDPSLPILGWWDDDDFLRKKFRR